MYSLCYLLPDLTIALSYTELYEKLTCCVATSSADLLQKLKCLTDLALAYVLKSFEI